MVNRDCFDKSFGIEGMRREHRLEALCAIVHGELCIGPHGDRAFSALEAVDDNGRPLPGLLGGHLAVPPEGLALQAPSSGTASRRPWLSLDRSSPRSR